jgi:hypothetical protein
MARVANNELSNGWTDFLTVKHGDLTAENTTQSFTIPIPAGGIVYDVGVYLETAFDGGSISSLKIDVGDGSDADGYIDNIEIAVDATEVTYTLSNGVYLKDADASTVNLHQGKLYTSADTIDILFTGSHNVDTLDTGKVTVWVDMKRLNPEA